MAVGDYKRRGKRRRGCCRLHCPGCEGVAVQGACQVVAVPPSPSSLLKNFLSELRMIYEMQTALFLQ